MAKDYPTIDKSFQAECDLRTLVEADKIMRDSKRFAAAKRKAEKESRALEDVQGLRRK